MNKMSQIEFIIQTNKQIGVIISAPEVKTDPGPHVATVELLMLLQKIRNRITTHISFREECIF